MSMLFVLLFRAVAGRGFRTPPRINMWPQPMENLWSSSKFSKLAIKEGQPWRRARRHSRLEAPPLDLSELL